MTEPRNQTDQGKSGFRTVDISERRTPPHSLEAEMAVLGGALLRNEALDEVRDLLESEDFYQPAHQRLFSAFCTLYDRKDVIDPVTLRNELTARGWFEECGGRAYIDRLLDEVHTSANIASYAKIVKEKAVLRRMLGATFRVQGMVYDGKDDDGNVLGVEEVLNQSHALVDGVTLESVQSPFEALENILVSTLKHVDERQTSKGQLAGHSTGFIDLDEKTNGLKSPDLIIIAARPGMGKTSLALNIGLTVALEDNPVLMFSLEMNLVQLGMRLLSSYARTPIYKIVKGMLNDAEHLALCRAAETLNDAPFFIDDTSGINIGSIRAKARRLKADKKGKLGLVIIDYLQMMQSPRKFESREREIADISRNLKLLAKDLDCPVLALSQLNRNLENRPDKRPRPSDLRESGSLEQDSDLVMFLYRDAIYNETDDPDLRAKTELIIGKQRSGPTGTVLLTFQDEITRFDSYTDRITQTRAASWHDPKGNDD